MWLCPNCETANNSRKRKCAVCDSEKPFSNENPNSPSILKSKIQELDEQILILKQEQFSFIQNEEKLILELNMKNASLLKSIKEKDNLLKQLEKIISDKTNIEYKLNQVENDNKILFNSFISTKTELEIQVTILQKSVVKLKQNENTLGIIIIVLAIWLFLSIVFF